MNVIHHTKYCTEANLDSYFVPEKWYRDQHNHTEPKNNDSTSSDTDNPKSICHFRMSIIPSKIWYTYVAASEIILQCCTGFMVRQFSKQSQRFCICS